MAMNRPFRSSHAFQGKNTGLPRPQEKSETADDLLTNRQAAEFLHVHANTMRKLGDHNTIPVIRIGPRRDRRFRRGDLEKFRDDELQNPDKKRW